jgi:hypothetical protein
MSPDIFAEFTSHPRTGNDRNDNTPPKPRFQPSSLSTRPFRKAQNNKKTGRTISA